MCGNDGKEYSGHLGGAAPLSGAGGGGLSGRWGWTVTTSERLVSALGEACSILCPFTLWCLIGAEKYLVSHQLYLKR